MKRCNYLFFLYLLLSPILFSLPKIAVIDAIVHKNVDKAVIVPVTQNIIEQLVASKKYIVLDRANIEKAVGELEFQVSGMVKDSDIKKLGNYLGAELLVIIDISIIEDIYFVSAKMIEVETGVIRKQVSHKDRGNAGIIFDISQVVAGKLIDKEVEDTHETAVENIARAEITSLTYAITKEKTIRFSVSDMVLSGMKNKKIRAEFWLSQESAWISTSRIVLDPLGVDYDPTYWNGEAFYFYYPLTKFAEMGNPNMIYWGSFFVYNNDTNDLIIQKDVSFSLPADLVSGNTNPTDNESVVPLDYGAEGESHVISRLIVSYQYPFFMGDMQEIFKTKLAAQGLSPTQLSPLCFNVHMLIEIDQYLYFSFFGSYYRTNLDSSGSSKLYLSQFGAEGGVGFATPIAGGLQVYFGGRIGLYSITLEEAWTVPPPGNSQLCLSWAAESGMDIILDAAFVLNVAFQYQSVILGRETGSSAIFPAIATSPYSGKDSVSLDNLSVSVGMGFAF